jgi:exportin-1
LKLIETYVEKADDLEMVRTNIVPALLDAVLVDYNRNVPNARDAEVLKVMSAIITKLSVRWTPHRSKYSVGHPIFSSRGF